MSAMLKAFQQHISAIRRTIAKYCPNKADIDELTQETFLKGFAVELESEVHNPEHLLMVIAKNLAIKHIQKKCNSQGISVEDIGGIAVLIDERQVSPADQLDGRRKLFVLTQALANLSPELRQSFVMRRIDGLRYKQIATRLNVSVSTVEKRVAMALVDILSYLRNLGFEQSEFGINVVTKGNQAKQRALRSERKETH